MLKFETNNRTIYSCYEFKLLKSYRVYYYTSDIGTILEVVWDYQLKTMAEMSILAPKNSQWSRLNGIAYQPKWHYKKCSNFNLKKIVLQKFANICTYKTYNN